MAEQTIGVSVSRLPADERPLVVRAFIGGRVHVVAQWGATADARTSHQGYALALAQVYGEPGVTVLVLSGDDGRVLAVPMSRLARIARANPTSS